MENRPSVGVRAAAVDGGVCAEQGKTRLVRPNLSLQTLQTLQTFGEPCPPPRGSISVSEAQLEQLVATR